MIPGSTTWKIPAKLVGPLKYKTIETETTVMEKGYNQINNPLDKLDID